MPQTTVQREDALRYGSTLLEIGDDVGSLVNLGAIRDMVFNSKVENFAINFDNVAEIKKFKNGDKASFSFLLGEVDLATFAETDDGLVVYSTVAATLVSGEEDTVASGAYASGDFIELLNQNGNASAITVNSVTGATDGLLTVDDDYQVVKGANGKYGIVLNIAGTTLTTMAQVFTINYDYTPAASKVLTFNDFGTKTLKVARITNTNENGDTFIIDLEDVTNIQNLTMPFLADDADDVMTMEMELEGTITQITDTQSVS